MSEYSATITWRETEAEDFVRGGYSRGHSWSFDGGVVLPASSSTQVVPLPYSVETNVDPEEAFVASLSSCHMLLFLSVAAKRRFVVTEYADNAVGSMAQNEDGRIAITRVVLRPRVSFSGEKQPTRDPVEKMHHQSQRQCFIANSVTTEVVTEIPE